MTEQAALAIDIGGTSVKLGLVDRAGTIHGERGVATPEGGAPDLLVERIVRAAGALRREHGDKGLRGAGVSVAGFLDRTRGCMEYNPNLPLLSGFPLRDALEAALRLPCVLEVDSNAVTLAEHRLGAGRGSTRFLGLTIGTGLGGGVVIDGALLRFTGECAGDIGHVIADPQGPLCSCGGHGCLEAFVSAPALERNTGRPAREAIESARAGDPACVEALRAMGEKLGIGLAALVSLFAPRRIAIGGGVAAAGDLLLDPARETFFERAPFFFKDAVTIVPAMFGPKAGLVGAACCWFDAARA